MILFSGLVPIWGRCFGTEFFLIDKTSMFSVLELDKFFKACRSDFVELVWCRLVLPVFDNIKRACNLSSAKCAASFGTKFESVEKRMRGDHEPIDADMGISIL